jgi:murein L,D-transpeptidase YcbB/YkuD
MRDCLNQRTRLNRLLLAVAATALASTALSVFAGSAFAESDAAKSTAAEVAIEAAIPIPEPANVPPPTVSDFKPDVPASDAKPAVSRDTADAPSEAKPDSPAAAAAGVSSQPATLSPPAAAIPTTPAMATPAMATPAMAEPGRDLVKDPGKDLVQQPSKDPSNAAANVTPANPPVVDRLRELLTSKSQHYFDRKAERAAVEKFYAAHEFAPLWTRDGALTESAKGVIARLKDAASDGLDAADYPVPDFPGANSPDLLAEADLKLTASMLDYARQAQSGRMHWSQVSGDIQYPEHPVDPAEVIERVTSAKNASAALDSYNPPQKLYQELKAKLAELRGLGDTPAMEIAEGPVLRFTPPHGKKQPAIEMQDARVPQLRARLGLPDHAGDDYYDEKLAEAVRKFQDGADLKPTGVLDDKTVKALNSPKRDHQIDTVIVNMERWRWLPRQLGASTIGNAYVILNIPDYTLKVMQNGAPIWTTKVVTGQPGIHATPLLTETMKYITVNPTWNVPPSIIYNEYLPALQQDPTVLQRMGLKLDRAPDGSIHISQPPGEANALGRIRFNFPNKFLVYQHDTPDKNLFAREERAFSHGCMRVQNPDQYAATLLNITEPNEHYTPEKIRSLYGQSEIDLKFPTPIPVNITYQTAFVDDAGKLQFRRDVYGRDANMLALLRGGRSKDLENVIAHSQPNYVRPTPVLPAGVTFASDNSSSGPSFSGPSFFERLFGPSTPPAPPQPPALVHRRHSGG